MQDALLLGAIMVAVSVCCGHSAPIKSPMEVWREQNPPRAEVAVATKEDGEGPEKLIAVIEGTYGVPGWYTYATWQIESNGSSSGAGTSKNWLLAADLVKEGSACDHNKSQALGHKAGLEWCQRQWRALKVICAQTNRSGEKVCDSQSVKTSWAFAMGPMQMLPTNIVKVSDDGIAWVSNAADFDGDGAVNPLALPDAMAMSAKLSRHFHGTVGGGDSVESWLKTSGKYLGDDTAKRRAKILEHADEWCDDHDCGDAQKEQIASR